MASPTRHSRRRYKHTHTDQFLEDLLDPTMLGELNTVRHHLIEQVGRKLRSLMKWIKAKEIE